MTAFTGALDELVSLIQNGRRFLVTGHLRPDGDAVGSMLATAGALRALGKEVVIYNRDRAPARLAFLPGADEIRTKVATTDIFDATIIHDCAQLAQVGELPGARAGKIVFLDHHLSTANEGDLVVRDPQASAVGVLVGRLLARLNVPLTRPIAEALWCSLVSDTGWFRYPATDLETFDLARACLAAGVVPWEFARRAEEEQPVARLRLLALVVPSLRIVDFAEHKAAFLFLASGQLREAGAAPEHCEGFVNYARSLAGVEVGVFLAETGRGVRVSLRSKGSFDVARIAEKEGGGGHAQAAGCLIVGTLENAFEKLSAHLQAP